MFRPHLEQFTTVPVHMGLTLCSHSSQNPFEDEGGDADGKSKAEVMAEKKLWLTEPDRDYTYTEVCSSCLACHLQRQLSCWRS